MLVCFASEKGGAGKTTLAAALAERLHAWGVPVRLADGDRQASLAAVAEASEGRLPPVQQVFPMQFSRLKDEQGLVLLDLPSGIGVELNAALAVADVAIVPAVPSAFDLRTLPATLSHVRREQELRQGPPRALLVPNKINLRETMSRELLERISELGWPTTRVWLQERAVYRHMGTAGLGALATNGRKAAEAEVAALADEVLAFLGVQRVGAAA